MEGGWGRIEGRGGKVEVDWRRSEGREGKVEGGWGVGKGLRNGREGVGFNEWKGKRRDGGLLGND